MPDASSPPRPGPRRPGPSIRLKLTLSYAGLLVLAGVLLLGVVWLFLLRYVPDGAIPTRGGFVPNRTDLIRAFAPAATGVLSFLLVLGLAGGWFLAGRMLRPLTRIGDAARLAAQGSLSHRIRLEGAQDELRELADVVDTMLERLQSHVAEQQRFAANASHELRTPLAISQALLEVARHDPDRDVEALIDRLENVNSRAVELTEALLLLSRVDGRSFARDAVDLSLVAEEAVETLFPLAARRGVTLDIGGTSARTIGSAALLLQMTTNLVQNAIVHNLPAGGLVSVHTETRRSTAVVHVENTGPPLAPELVATLTEPFRRGTERLRDDDQAGVGLGLAIVQSIIRAHGGTWSLAPRPAGGLVVTVHLPTAPQAAPHVS
ncbi:two-component system sensor histidine kinase VanS [Actinoalloteichus hoggarensis]|uniref:histidine kinase n=1 Tax=Actinoalloteichus hoggarensis TaxID=1470176 RepID=A0A221W5Y6_9PSEU|nr:HAMP domain-containing sensor histidine kinase [Actinoalloteichus hoggarensis]ASO21104.1 putative sensor histidine kinase TcrY [Actinoalloteichus hoggarensis]MBB5921033.1 two-component system sensor histidine kinase VanS [Actinoalloteichus hoggarensis]